jgi:hypothetical protein
MNEKIIAKIYNQTIGSTSIDSQGEKIPKEILEELCQSGSIPLQQNHQPEKGPIGYIENLHLVPDERQAGEWLLKGDVFYTEEPKDIKIGVGGFSWSITKLNNKYEVENCSYALYLPYPFYNNETLLGSLARLDERLSLGYWYKKTADPAKIALLVSFILFFLEPPYDKFFNEVLWPKIKTIFGKIPKIKENGIVRVDFVQNVSINGHRVNVYFFPGMSNEVECYQKDKIMNALDLIYRYTLKDKSAKIPGYSTIKLHWNSEKKEYFIDCIEYRDGTYDIFIINQ